MNISCCRVCGESNKAANNVALYNEDENELTPSGELYEELLNLPLKNDNTNLMEVCNSCDLQLKLFKQLKEKAKRTLSMLTNEQNEDQQEEFAEEEYEVKEEEWEDEYTETELHTELVEPAEPSDNNFMDVQYLDEAITNKPVDKSKKKKVKLRKGYDCYYCQQHFNKRDEYQRHRSEVHENKYPCLECPKVLKTADALRVHMNLHRGKKSYKCEICDRSFNQKVHLVYHLNKHNNVRQFHCELCSKSFLSKADLSMHIRTHTGDKRYVCEVCGKGFLLHEHLKMHKYSHSGLKAFRCNVCYERFVSPATLRTHIYNLHREIENLFKCEYCGKQFKKNQQLIAHYKVHKKEETSNILYQEEQLVNDMALAQTEGAAARYMEMYEADTNETEIDTIFYIE